MSVRLLNEDTVVDYLVGRKVLDADTPATVAPLGGGVSNVVLSVNEFVVKQSLPQLRVEEEWLAKQERAITEAAALQLANDVVPGSAPAVIDVDEAAFTLTIERAPDSWRNWKDELLEGRADAAVAARLGHLLGAWHAATGDRDGDGDGDGMRRFDDPEAFEQLRVDPYYRTILARHPALAGPIGGCIERMAATKQCLVHGDYSPKNVLLGDAAGEVWVLDFEVAHLGDPAFDLAFLHNHLVLKALHRPQAKADYRRCSDAFREAYEPPTDEPYVLAHLGCLLLARVDGKSPAEYLTPDERSTARKLAVDVLVNPPADFDDLWERLP
jgi:tRNA A-37 threonylcarbamoyl transferase component Bud32